MSRAAEFGGPEGSTPLRDEDIAALIPTWVATRADLNRAEYANVLAGLAWAETRLTSRAPQELLTEKIICRLHREMFGDVWRWAGSYRRHDTNIGVSWTSVPLEMRKLLGDISHQVAMINELPWSPDEISVRFHHRLVSVHPFPNGNGRHARLAADSLVQTLGGSPFTWGREALNADGPARGQYLSALRSADESGEFGPLLRFARS